MNSKMTVTPEEALYLAEFSNYKFVRDCQLLSPELFLSLFPDKVFDSYKVHLASILLFSKHITRYIEIYADMAIY